MKPQTNQPKAKVRYVAPGPVAAAYGDDRTFASIIMGPLAGGKTKTSIIRIMEMLCQQRPDRNGVRRARVGIIRNTYPDLLTTTIRDWQEVFPKGLGTLSKGHPPEHKLDFDLPDGTKVLAEVIFLALDKEDDVKKLRGTQFTFIWINELKEISKAIFDMATGRVDRYPIPQWSTYAGVMGDTNAWDEDHWLNDLYQQWLEGKLPDFAFFMQPGAVKKEDGKWVINTEAENLKVVGEQYYLRQLQGKKESYISVNLANMIGLHFDGKAVHPEYADSIHTAREELTLVPGKVWVGADHGLTPAMVIGQKVDGQWRIVDELVGDNIGAENFAVEVNSWKARWAATAATEWLFRGDPAGDERAQTDENTVGRIYRQNGIMMIAAPSNDVGLRRAALERPLTRMAQGKPGIIISPRCRKLRKGLAGAFHYKRVAVSGAERYRDVPDKNEYSHVVEALEYMLLAAGENATSLSPQPGPMRAMAQPAVKQDWSPYDI